MNLSGLSAIYPGYSAQENQTAETEKNQAAAQDAALGLIANNARGRALVHLMTGQVPPQGPPGNQGPMPPQPGQPSMPNQPAPPAMTPPVQGGQPAAPQPPLVPQARYQPPVQRNPDTGTPEVSLQNLTRSLLAANPGIERHPAVLMKALDQSAALLDRQSKEDLYDLRQKFQEQTLAQRERIVQMQQEGLNQRNQATVEGRKIGRAS